ncbi:MAG: WGR domain-containing protein [Myxococcota bacterium]
MADWNVHLEFSDGSSNKFWRARVEGGDLTTNWGRIGTDGQTKTKSIGSPDAALAELEKQANGKRKKGYIDTAGGAPKDEAPPPEALVETWSATMKLQEAGRTVELTLACDGKTLTTSVQEVYESDDSAGAAYQRIKQKLIEDGYTTK